MSLTLKQTVLSIAVAASTSASFPVSAAVYDFDFKGLFTMVMPAGDRSILNTGYPHYSSPEWGYGKRTNISGTMHLDTSTGTGSGTVAPFDFMTQIMNFHSISLQAIGDGFGGPGSLILGNMLFDWGGNNGVPVSIVMDARGLFGAMEASGGALGLGKTVDGTHGVLSASDGVWSGTAPMGKLAMASTTWNTSLVGPLCANVHTSTCMNRNPSGGLPLGADSISGDPMVAGPFIGYNATFDVQTMTVVPIPAAAWLLAPGLVGLLAMARRREVDPTSKRTTD